MIRDLLSRGVEPQRILYYSCDLVEGPKRLLELLRSYLGWARRLTRERLYLFLDEVSSVRDWQLAVKQLADLGQLRDCTLVLTGSHSLDVKRSSERMPGRRGRASTPLDKVMLPMKFAEYVETLDEEIAGLLRR
ncbi:MAG: AAA family ATPase, partial [Candidatus Korarchaeota archaeon]|nr:AAA family ATPase [Candidatus Korarchaeota archaeon]